MSNEDLDARYQTILENERLKGNVAEEGGEKERRRHPRIKVVPGDKEVEIDPWVFVIDVSISGVAFYSDHEVEPGKTVDIDLADTPPVKAKVIGCQMEKSDSPYLPSRYRLNCEFENEEEGKALLVRIKEMEGENQAPMAN